MHWRSQWRPLPPFSAIQGTSSGAARTFGTLDSGGQWHLLHRDFTAFGSPTNVYGETANNLLTAAQDWELDQINNWSGFDEDSDGNGTNNLVQDRTHKDANENAALDTVKQALSFDPKHADARRPPASGIDVGTRAVAGRAPSEKPAAGREHGRHGKPGDLFADADERHNPPAGSGL